jgi:hypothetical protein
MNATSKNHTHRQKPIKLLLHDCMHKFKLFETYRIMNPDANRHTHFVSHSITSSCLDYLYTNKYMLDRCTSSNTIDTSGFAFDHHAVVGLFNLPEITDKST